jgi:hypothetical protein
LTNQDYIPEWSTRGLPVRRTVDHPLGDETRPARRDRLDPHPECGGDIAGAVAVGSENGHGSEVVLLLGSQPIEPNAEEVAVERVDDARSGRPDVVAGNRTRGRRIPDVVAPFLEEVRVAAGLRHDTVDRRGSQLDPEFVGRNDNGRRSFLRRQRAQDGELEEALGIGPGRADQSRQLRQAGAGQDDRQTELCRPVNGRHQGGELVGGQVLDFVDDHHQRGFASGRGLAGRHEYIGQVFRQQARIRPAGDWVDADGDRRSHRQLERERLEHAQRGGDRSANQAVPLEQNPPQPNRQQRAKVTVLGRLDEPDLHPLGARDLGETVQQDGLADTSQPDEHAALGRPAAQMNRDRDIRSSPVGREPTRRLPGVTGRGERRLAETLLGTTPAARNATSTTAGTGVHERPAASAR